MSHSLFQRFKSTYFIMSNIEMEDASTLEPRCATVVHQLDEVFNIQSQERANLLSELRHAIQKGYCEGITVGLYASM